MMTSQLAFVPWSRRLLGVQVVGRRAWDKRLDLLVSVIKSKGTIYDLTEMEHAYAPPFSSAKDPVNIAGFAAEKILQYRIKTFSWNNPLPAEGECFLLDVRSENEFDAGHIEGAVNILLDNLRNRLAELPGKKRFICITGSGCGATWLPAFCCRMPLLTYTISRAVTVFGE